MQFNVLVLVYVRSGIKATYVHVWEIQYNMCCVYIFYHYSTIKYWHTSALNFNKKL